MKPQTVTRQQRGFAHGTQTLHMEQRATQERLILLLLHGMASHARMFTPCHHHRLLWLPNASSTLARVRRRASTHALPVMPQAAGVSAGALTTRYVCLLYIRGLQRSAPASCHTHSAHAHGCSSKYCNAAARNDRLGKMSFSLHGARVTGSKGCVRRCCSSTARS